MCFLYGAGALEKTNRKSVNANCENLVLHQGSDISFVVVNCLTTQRKHTKIMIHVLIKIKCNLLSASGLCQTTLSDVCFHDRKKIEREFTQLIVHLYKAFKG